MKKKVIIIGSIILAIVILITIGYFMIPKEDITGTSYGEGYSYSKEKMCCRDCLSYGEYESSKSCLEIIGEHGGIKHCYLVFNYSPHTYLQCKKVIGQ